MRNLWAGDWMRDLAVLLLLIIAAELVALLIVCVQAWRNPHGKEPASRVPDYVPDDWLGGGSPHETRPGGGVVPYDRDDEYPGWGIPDGDTKPATDTPSVDRGMEGQSP